MSDFEQKLKRHFERRDKALSVGYRIVQEVYRMQIEQRLIVEANELNNYFSHNYNPEKGETAKSEMEKWFEFIKGIYGITVSYSMEKDHYIFHKKYLKNG